MGALKYRLCIDFVLFMAHGFEDECVNLPNLSVHVCWSEKLFPSSKTQACEGILPGMVSIPIPACLNGNLECGKLFIVLAAIPCNGTFVLSVSCCLSGRFKWASATSVYVISWSIWMFSSVTALTTRNQNFPSGVSALFTSGQRWAASPHLQVGALQVLPVTSHFSITRDHFHSSSSVDSSL